MRNQEAGPGQESVWDYPRPPRLERCSRRVRVIFAGQTIADSTGALRLLEISHPPAYYIPPEDLQMEWLHPAAGSSFCEFKGVARYWDLKIGSRRSARAAWSYPAPSRDYLELKDHLCFYAGRVDACFVDDLQVTAQPGDFYGGWITADIVGPFKGGPGTLGW